MPNNQAIHYIGRVLDKEKQAPISGAKVTINLPGSSLVIHSDLEGIYKFQVPFDNSSVLEGEITIEAKGYKTYYSFIRLLAYERDLGDIRLVYPQSQHYQEAENDSNLLPIIAAIMVVLALILAALTLPPPQETPPLENPDNRINLQQPFHVSRNTISEGFPSSRFSQHKYEIAS
ncbi:peptidase associated/transthyretin-like domain-containing protein [Mastigocladopsis repens]|uniref:carboxypeptidase-like regulatory domain-containing protein n=1 Tax=Mastigocladopsis repens TaxID=221287 RepID=UPI0003076383|nr:carboxypeptidase-like regulatory domain-containing protein [Mastigocladopsis repens]